MLGDNDVARCDVIWRQTRLKRHLPGRLPDDANDSPSFGSDVLQLIPKSRWLITYRVNSVLLVNHGDPPVVRRADRVGLDLRLRGTRHDAQLIVRQLAPERLGALSERPEQNCGPFGRTAASEGMLQRAALAIGRVPDDRCSISRERWVNPANRKPITGTGPGCGATANANTGYSLSARRTGQNDLLADVTVGAEICRSLKVLTALGVPVAGSGVRATAESR